MIIFRRGTIHYPTDDSTKEGFFWYSTKYSDGTILRFCDSGGLLEVGDIVGDGVFFTI